MCKKNFWILLIILISFLFLSGCTSIDNSSNGAQINTNANVVKESASNEGIICKDIAYSSKNAGTGEVLEKCDIKPTFGSVDFSGCSEDSGFSVSSFIATYKNTTNKEQEVYARFLFGPNFVFEMFGNSRTVKPGKSVTLEGWPNNYEEKGCYESFIVEMYDYHTNVLLAKDSFNYNLDSKEQILSSGVYPLEDRVYDKMFYYDYKNTTNKPQIAILRALVGPNLSGIGRITSSYLTAEVPPNGVRRLKSEVSWRYKGDSAIVEVYSVNVSAGQINPNSFKFLEKASINRDLDSKEPTVAKGKYYRNKSDSGVQISKEECELLESKERITFFYIDYLPTSNSPQEITIKFKYLSDVGEEKVSTLKQKTYPGFPTRIVTWENIGIDGCIEQTAVEFYDKEENLLKKDIIQ